MINPINRIALFAIKRIYRHVLPEMTFNSFVNVFRGLGSTSMVLVNTIGFIPTLQILNSIRRLLININTNSVRVVNRTLNFTTLFNSYYPEFNTLYPSAINLLGVLINPIWKSCLDFPKVFIKIYNIFLFITYFSFFKYIFRFSFSIFKLFLGGILSTLGIL
jgi:hypothetical protein